MRILVSFFLCLALLPGCRLSTHGQSLLNDDRDAFYSKSDPAMAEAARLLQANRRQQAISILRERVGRGAVSPAAYAMLGYALLQEEDHESSVAYLLRGLTAFPRSALLHSAAAEVMTQTGDLQSALQHLLNAERILTEDGNAESVVSLHRVQNAIGTIRLTMASEAVSSDDIERAIEHLRMAVTYRPEAPVYATLIGALVQTRRHTEALSVAANAIVRLGPDPGLLVAKGLVLMETDRLPEALEILEDAHTSAGGGAEAGLLYAHVLLRSGRVLDAYRIYEQLLDEHPEDRGLHDSFLTVLERTHNSAGQLDLLKLMRERFPQDFDLLRRAAEAAERAGELTRSRAYYDTLAAVTGNVELSRYRSALSFAREWRFQKAEELLSTLVDAHPDSLEYLRSLADVLLAKRSWLQAEKLYRELAARQPDAEVSSALAHVLYKQKRLSDARSSYRRAITLEPRIVYPRFLLAQITDEPEKACSHFATALRLSLNAQESPNRAPGLSTPSATDSLWMPWTQRMQTTAWADPAFASVVSHCPQPRVAKLVNELADEHPDSPSAALLFGRHHLSHENFDKADGLLKRAVELRPRDAEARLARAELFDAVGDSTKAILSYERTRTLNPENEQAYRALIRLHDSSGEINVLADRWLAYWRSDSDNEVLKEYLLEALHKSGRFEEASMVVRDRLP